MKSKNNWYLKCVTLSIFHIEQDQTQKVFKHFSNNERKQPLHDFDIIAISKTFPVSNEISAKMPNVDENPFILPRFVYRHSDSLETAVHYAC